MPTYEYLCPKGHPFEVFQRITAEPGANCPECGEKAERQLSSGGGLLFKGSGFYITDYRSDSYKKSASQEKPAGGPEAKPKESGSPGGGAAGGGSSGGGASSGGSSSSGKSSSSGSSGASSSGSGD